MKFDRLVHKTGKFQDCAFCLALEMHVVIQGLERTEFTITLWIGDQLKALNGL